MGKQILENNKKKPPSVFNKLFKKREEPLSEEDTTK